MMFICCRLFFFLSFFLQVSHQSVKFFIFHFTGSQVDFVADQKGLNSFSTCHIKILLSQASTTPTTYNKPVEGGAVARISSDWRWPAALIVCLIRNYSEEAFTTTNTTAATTTAATTNPVKDVSFFLNIILIQGRFISLFNYLKTFSKFGNGKIWSPLQLIYNYYDDNVLVLCSPSRGRYPGLTCFLISSLVINVVWWSMLCERAEIKFSSRGRLIALFLRIKWNIKCSSF